MTSCLRRFSDTRRDVASATTRGAGVLLIGTLLLFKPVAAQDADTEGPVWSRLGLRHELPSAASLYGFAQLKDGIDYGYTQWDFGLQLIRPARRFTRANLFDVNPDQQHAFVFGAGYEYLETTQSGTSKPQNRLSIEGSFRNRPSKSFALSDRNRFEFRWIAGTYSTRYRNRLVAQLDLEAGSQRLSPYASAEFFYTWGTTNSWNEARYSGGMTWQAPGSLALSLFYLRQDCWTCHPVHVNALGVDLTWFTGRSSR